MLDAYYAKPENIRIHKSFLLTSLIFYSCHCLNSLKDLFMMLSEDVKGCNFSVERRLRMHVIWNPSHVKRLQNVRKISPQRGET